MDITGLPLAAIPSPAAAPPEQAANNRILIQAVKAVNEVGTFGDNEVTFQIDRNSKLPLIQVIDRSTKEVVDQIPAEYILKLAENLGKNGAKL